MAIIWNEREQVFSLQTRSSTYQMKVDRFGYLLHTYYGGRLEAVQDLSYLIPYEDRGFSGNPYEAGDNRKYSLDLLPQEISCYGTGDYRSPALKIRYSSGSSATKLHYKKHGIFEGKYRIEGLPAIYAEKEEADTLEIILEDREAKVELCLRYGVLEKEDTITRSVCITNHGSRNIYLEKVMSTHIDFLHGEFDLITFYGRHAMERLLSRAQVHHGMQSIGSSRGTSGHHYNPAMILCEPSANEDTGECYGITFVYSGDFIGEVEHDSISQTRVQMGIGSDNFCFQLQPQESFEAPEAIMIYSGQGLARLSNCCHDLFRNNLCRGEYRQARRPILINNWEGTYFDFTGEKLLSIAKEAAKLGVELFVMDDGWFGKRDHDVSGLGDWEVNERKLGCTLKDLSAMIRKEGMEFGIWFEPECISEDSDLYRAHPDWSYQIPGRKPNRSRFQLILDFSRKEIREYIYDKLCKVLDSADITYVKWDFNRSICDIYSAMLPADKQKETAHRYILGLYDLLEKLNRRYPHILFESCSGGGGRFDPGMLYYTPQIWCSDDTDAIERLKIQYGTSFFYPVSTMGSHVSASPNHQTGRNTPLHTRSIVAMSGTYGFELDVNKLTENEKEEIRNQITEFKRLSDVIQYGDYYRLSEPGKHEFYTVWETVNKEKTLAIVNIVSTRSQANSIPVYIRLKGLKPEENYACDGKIYPGAALIHAGIRLPLPEQEYQAWQYIYEMIVK